MKKKVFMKIVLYNKTFKYHLLNTICIDKNLKLPELSEQVRLIFLTEHYFTIHHKPNIFGSRRAH